MIFKKLEEKNIPCITKNCNNQSMYYINTTLFNLPLRITLCKDHIETAKDYVINRNQKIIFSQE